MAHHQLTNHDRALAAQGLSSSSFHGVANASTTGEDDLTSEPEEPPDTTIQFAKLVTPGSRHFDMRYGHECVTSSRPVWDRTESLLTQALLSSPELNPMSDVEAPVLTSDGGLTSPARTTTPSPPTPTVHHRDLDRFSTNNKPETSIEQSADPVQIAPARIINRSQETNVEAGLGRKRCISFACGRQSTSQKTSDPLPKKQESPEQSAKALDPPKRPCLLKFACPMKPSRSESPKIEKVVKRGNSPSPIQRNPMASYVKTDNVTTEHGAPMHRDSNATIRSSPSRGISLSPAASFVRKGKAFNRIDFQNSEATRFHEFAGPFNTEDEWTNEQTAFRQKITINDTLRKENAIRRLAEEAEEEALEEEAEDRVINDDQENDDELNDDDGGEVSNDGNETDDEEGFAESDNESDGDSDYHFWTPGLTTAATSTDHLEHIRPLSHRIASESSIESAINLTNSSARTPRESQVKSPRLRPGTPSLPDNSDFVVGTIDEDHHLEEAYMSCLEERRRSRHKLIPQDIDPRFPTSEPEPDLDDDGVNDDDEDDEEGGRQEEEKRCVPCVEDRPDWVVGRPEPSEDGKSFPARQSPSSTKATNSRMPSPKQALSPPSKRLHSPPPKRATVHRSPPPRRLFGRLTHRLRSPPPMHRKLTSPPSSRRPSVSGSPPGMPHGIDMPHLAQRPNLTHTTSLPRTPNPFWLQHRRAHFHDSDTPSAGTSPKAAGQSRGEVHSRGPIDIVQGLETKRQRRKDKFWRQHCRTAGRDKGRRCQPGKGAERMKELGLEMADRFRGYGQKAQLVLSV